MPRYRIAYLTPEFPTESLGPRGGLANYLRRATQAMRNRGHEVHVFTETREQDETIDYQGIPVHRVLPQPELVPSRYRWLRSLGRVGPILSCHCLAAAAAVSRTFAQQHQASPFDLVQSSDYKFPGLFVTPTSGLKHIVRCSLTASLIHSSHAKRFGIGRFYDHWLLHHLERKLFQQVDGVYAPSHYAAEKFTLEYGVPIGVVRPPLADDAPAIRADVPPQVPEKYLLFVGHLNRVKGFDLVIAALKKCWARDDSIRLVCAGTGEQPGLIDSLGPDSHRVISLGLTPKDQVHELMRRATAVVAPSREDNLPNVVLEAVTVGTPVIGSDGASIDEIVEPGFSGVLIAMEDVDALAEAMVDMWQGGAEIIRNQYRRPKVLEEMATEQAMANVLSFAGLDDS